MSTAPLVGFALAASIGLACKHGSDATGTGNSSGPTSGTSTSSSGTASSGGPVTTGPCLPPDVQAFLNANCTPCHTPAGGQFPTLVGEDPTWAVPPWIVPGNPSRSIVYQTVIGTQKTGQRMPPYIPDGGTQPDPAPLLDWIQAGAPTSCDAGAPSAPTDPNSLPQAELFTCPSGTKSAPSPGRIRRIESPEWTYSLPQPLNGIGASSNQNNTGYLNPFTPPATATYPYSTYSVDLTLDVPTLDLYFQNLPQAPASWSNQGGGAVLIGVSQEFACIYKASPTATCIHDFIDGYLSSGVLARTPSADDVEAGVTLLTQTIAAETDISQRPASLMLVGEALWLTAPALFRTELGDAGADTPTVTPLTNEELALTLGGMLSFHRPGARLMAYEPAGYAPPDPDDPCHTWLQKIVDAAADGSIQSPTTIKALFQPAFAATPGYGGGIDPGGNPYTCTLPNDAGTLRGTTPRRRDISFEKGTAYTDARGAYWLAPRIADFFRQWLGYGTANASFKDTPGATSKYATSESMFDLTTTSYTELQSGYRSGNDHEATLVEQMDDTVARAVIEATQNKVNVFKYLLTTPWFRVPSNQEDTIKSTTCTQSSDCTALDAGTASCSIPITCGVKGEGCVTAADCPAGNTCASQFGYRPMSCPSGNVCVAPTGTCVDSTGGSSIASVRVYNLDGPIAQTDSARWVQMPPTERMGVLTHPAWLAAHGDNFQDDPSIVHRGKWIRQSLLCETVPGLDKVQVQAKVGPGAVTMSARDRLNLAMEPICLNCHNYMNPLGYPFEMYNHAGFLRAYDKLATDAGPTDLPDASTTVIESPDPTLTASYKNAIDFTQALANSEYAEDCFIRQVFRYFVGRDETMADQCTLTAMAAALKSGSFFDMLGVLASSPTVLSRTNGG